MKNSGQLCPDDQQIDAALTTARVFAAESNHLQLLTLYEQRLNRTLQKNLALLQSLQAARKARRETEMQEAARLLQVSEIRGLEYQPAKDGFVFSNTEIPGLGNGFHKIQTQKISNASRFNEGITRRFKAQNRSIMLGGFLRPIMERFADRTKMLA